MVYKIILIGDAEVGKTNIISRYVDGKFLEENISTIGVEYKTKELNELNVNKEKIILQIWDTSGQEKYNAITKNYLRDSDFILFVFDVTKKESFENINNWLKLSEGIEGNFEKILVGNKFDKEEKEISNEDIINFSEEKNMRHFEISAKNGDKINDLFEYITNLIKEKKISRRQTEDFSEEIENKKENENENLNNQSSINSKPKLKKPEEKKKESGCC